MNKPFLTYYFQGMKFEFVRDIVFITDLEYKDQYQLMFTRDKEYPFVIQIVEKGSNNE